MFRFKKKKYQFRLNYLEEKSKSGHWGLKLVISGIIFLIVVSAIFYLAVFSLYFKFSEIKFQSSKEIKDEQLRPIISGLLDEKIYNKIPVNNPVFLPEQKIKDALLRNFPEFKQVTISKDLAKHALVIEIEQRQPSVIWCQVTPIVKVTEMNGAYIATSSDELLEKSMPEAEKCFFADDEGFIFSLAPIMSSPLIAFVFDEAEHDFKIGSVVSNQKMLKFIVEVKNQLMANNLDLNDFLVKSQSIGDLEIIASEGWRIYLSPNNSAESQIISLKRVLDEEIKSGRSRLEYIDLRVQNRVYYKLKK